MYLCHALVNVSVSMATNVSAAGCWLLLSSPQLLLPLLMLHAAGDGNQKRVLPHVKLNFLINFLIQAQ